MARFRFTRYRTHEEVVESVGDDGGEEIAAHEPESAEVQSDQARQDRVGRRQGMEHSEQERRTEPARSQRRRPADFASAAACTTPRRNSISSPSPTSAARIASSTIRQPWKQHDDHFVDDSGDVGQLAATDT